MNRAVFLDRDNTLIHADGEVDDPEKVRLIQGAASAIASLRGLGYRIVVISNQPGVARGALAEADVDAVNRRVAELVQFNSGASIDRFYYCPYHPDAPLEPYRLDHPWRKPSPGMLLQAADDLKLDLKTSWTIGDRPADVAAGQAAGTRTILLQPDGGESASHGNGDNDGDGDEASPHFTAAGLIEAVRLIAQRPPAESTESALAATARPDAPGMLEDESESDADAEAEAEADETPTGATAERPADPPEAPPRELPADPPADAPTPPAATDAHGPHPTPRPVAAEVAEDSTRESSGIPSPPFEETQPAAHRQPGLGRTRSAAAEATDPAEPAEPVAGRKTGGRARTNAAEPELVDVLRSLQRDLKARQADYGDFSYAKMAAALAQMLAIGCVLFGMIHVGEVDDFTRWMLGATFTQVLVITLLIVHGQR